MPNQEICSVNTFQVKAHSDLKSASVTTMCVNFYKSAQVLL